MIQLGKLFGRVDLGIEQGGHQHLDRAGGQDDADQAHRDRGRGHAAGPAVRQSLAVGMEHDHGVVLAGGQKVSDHRPGVERNAGTPGDLALLQGGEHPERRIAHIEQQQAARLEGGEVLEQKIPLVPVIRGDERVEDQAVERVVDLGDPRQGGGIAVRREHLAEAGDGVRRVGQAQGRSVDGAHVKTVPAPDRSLMVPTPHEMAVQFDECARLQLLPGGAERALGDNPVGQVGSVQDLKELVQFPLQRAFDQVQQEENHNRKRQGTLPGKVCLGTSMSGNERRIVDEVMKHSNYITIYVMKIPRSCL